MCPYRSPVPRRSRAFPCRGERVPQVCAITPFPRSPVLSRDRGNGERWGTSKRGTLEARGAGLMATKRKDIRPDGSPYPSTLARARVRAEQKLANRQAHAAMHMTGDAVPVLSPRELILWARRRYVEVVEDPAADERNRVRAMQLLEQSAQYEQDGPQATAVQVNVAQQVHPAAERLSQLPPEELAAELRRAGLIPGGEE